MVRGAAGGKLSSGQEFRDSSKERGLETAATCCLAEGGLSRADLLFV